MGLKYHYIQKDEQNRTWKLVSNVLSAVQFNERHTGENIKHKFQQSLNSLGINTTKIGYLVTDGASNMVCGFKNWTEEAENLMTDEDDSAIDLEDDSQPEDSDISESSEDEEEESNADDEVTVATPNITIGEKVRISCYAHTLQLVIKDVIGKGGRPKEVLDCAFKIVKYFMRSNYWRKRLKKVVGKVLIKPATRWNYIYYVLERLCQDKVYGEVCNLIRAASTCPKKPKNLPPTPSIEPQEKMIEIKNLLKPICDATNKLQGDGVTSSLIYYSIVNAFNEIAKTPTTRFTCMKAQLLDGLKNRFEKAINNDPHIILSALLDPRQKSDVFKIKPAVYGTRSLETPSIDKVTDMLKSYCKEDPSAEAALHTFPENEDNDDDPFSMLPRIVNSSNTIADEVDKYLGLQREPSKSDPLEFWAKNETSFKELSNLASQYLAIPASTGSVERLFSLLGSFGRSRRSSLNPKSLENLVLHREYRRPILMRAHPAINLSNKRKISLEPDNKCNKRKTLSTRAICFIIYMNSIFSRRKGTQRW
ncbi:zinc finger BED domain-containing protein 4-like [Folsomia candida]|uniref:zinc finger BED domain-containing protein 4-like n=1 Tax=Folsomia candida TaxID=158441 RepID=UPI0016055E6C|nr:zinc finger BED domain-containing protein 4-like [Folsomia candida]